MMVMVIIIVIEDTDNNCNDKNKICIVPKQFTKLN